MLYKFMFGEEELLIIKAALENTLSPWADNAPEEKAVDKLKAYILCEVEAQYRNAQREPTIIEKLKK